MLKRLQDLTKQGVLRQLDYQFAKFVAQRSPDPHSSLVALVAALVSHELGKGHVCLMLNKITAHSLFGLPSRVAAALLEGLPEPELWAAELKELPVVSDIANCEQQATPLVLDGGRLYLHRYWHFEQLVASKLHHTAQSVEPAAIMPSVLNELFPRTYTYLYQALQQLKKADSGKANTAETRQKEVCDKLDVVQAESLNWSEIDVVLTAATKAEELSALDGLVPLATCLNWQKVAAAMAITRQFAVISGGPGTGKTTTVAKLLAALVMQAEHGSSNGEVVTPNIKLVAPTGKAAARLTESIGMAVQSLPVDPEVRKRIPTQSSTIHRLLGSVPNQVDFRHHRDNPLHLDVLVVDEASMVDLPMMARLLDAMPPHAKLILLGDRDQLASVEAGAVLGDICAFASQGYSQQQGLLLSQLTGFDLTGGYLTGMDVFAGQTQTVSPVADSLCMLQKSYRFHAESGIGKLAKAINDGNPYHVEQVCLHGFKDINHYPLSAESYQTMINMTVTFYRDYFDAIEQSKEPKEVLKAFSSVRLLCALREGDFGVVGLNQRIERELVRIGKVSQADETWYEGRPVMIIRNDHGLGLYNGDIGIAMTDGKTNPDNPQLRVFFEMPDGSIRSVLPSRLPEHETVYAMTIHKSQGSEFADTLMVLPADFSPILTRELIYTGVTRAKEKLYLFAQPDVIQRAVRLRTERASGLACLLG
ncbi:exodeoxyribonuclease V subunit alpha [Photobacterium sp. SDRW27]|uniref:exodeoxyribonuclease V subunit alpha n=1 Tax=Photobacterium obscurum TaxID=2829490 RepID=UPI002242D502|nr:exodeoxyribonuclease V subunit alpha [Photobacterium obscurum]MCW8331304.1 exodeoxyribonuclease V subunit alpha [Photobacterium obscurum]